MHVEDNTNRPLELSQGWQRTLKKSENDTYLRESFLYFDNLYLG